MPLWVRFPGRVTPGSVSDRLVSLVDVLPTCADLLGLEVPAGSAVDGVSFAAALGAASSVPERDVLVMHSEAGVFALREGAWKLIEGTKGSGGWPPPTGGGPVPGAPGQLYDLAADPHETRDLFEARPDVVARLAARLDRIRGPRPS